MDANPDECAAGKNDRENLHRVLGRELSASLLSELRGQTPVGTNAALDLL